MALKRPFLMVVLYSQYSIIWIYQNLFNLSLAALGSREGLYIINIAAATSYVTLSSVVFCMFVFLKCIYLEREGERKREPTCMCE